MCGAVAKVSPIFGFTAIWLNALQLILDRVLDGDDLAGPRVDLVERAVERRGLARSAWAGDQEDPVRPPDEPLEARQHRRREAELLERQDTLWRSSRRMTIDSPCTVEIVEVRMSTRQPWSDDPDASVLRERRSRCSSPPSASRVRSPRPAAPRRRILIEQDPVDAVADAERVLERLDVDVRWTRR